MKYVFTAVAIAALLIILRFQEQPVAGATTRPTTVEQGRAYAEERGYKYDFYGDSPESPEWTSDAREQYWLDLEDQLREQAGVTVPAYTADSFGPATTLDIPPRTFAN